MARFFNTAGPCDPREHYMLGALSRVPTLRLPIERKQYFVLHAPRQSGKTTLMRTLALELTARGDVALSASLDPARGIPERDAAEAVVQAAIRADALRLPPDARPPAPSSEGEGAPGARLRSWLAPWAAGLSPRRLFLFLDEIDCLQPEPLLSVLAQLRAGYPARIDGLFPASVGLVGLRDLRDYVVAVRGGLSPGPSSPFNIKVESFTLADFTRAEIASLYSQHTDETGQAFAEDAIDRAWHWSRGQPYLVNALAARCVDVTVPDRSLPVLAHHIDAAAEHLVRARVTHLDNLAERLREGRVARTVQAVLLGDGAETVHRSSDDLRYVLDLGLLVDGPDGLAAANPLYAEVLTRELTVDVQAAVPAPTWPWKHADGTLDFPALLHAWRAWWRQNADLLDLGWAAGYPEAVPHLVLLAFLQRVVNGGGGVEGEGLPLPFKGTGKVHREFALGRGAIDILVEYGGQGFPVEVKRVAKEKVALESVIATGVDQLARYLDTLGQTEGWLIVFDQRPGKRWEERLWAREVERDGKRMHLLGG